MILEGIAGSGKTSVLRYLKKRAAETEDSWLVLNECLTERALEPLRSADLEKSLRHLNAVVSVIDALDHLSSAVPKRFQNQTRYLMERLHFSHCLDVGGFDLFDAYEALDRRMYELGARTVLLTVQQDKIMERSVTSTKTYRPASWANYLQSIADSDEGVAEYYSRQQEFFIGLCRRSVAASMIVDATNGDWEDLSFQIMDFLERD